MVVGLFEVESVPASHLDAQLVHSIIEFAHAAGNNHCLGSEGK